MVVVTEGNAKLAMDPTKVDFEEAYSTGVLGPGVVMEKLPWEIDKPQPILVELERAGHVQGDVLDVGCGRGDTAVYLAELGYRVTGVDISPTVIGKARDLAAERNVTATFDVADVTVLSGYEGSFDTVVSSALVHCLDEQQRKAHWDALVRVLRPGGRLIQFCFAKSPGSDTYAPYTLGEEEYRAVFCAPAWEILELRRDKISALKPPQAFWDLLGEELFPEFEGEDGMLLPVWLLEVKRV